MHMRAIMGRIAYKRGVLSVVEVGSEEPPEAACQVVRFERGVLLVRLDEAAAFLETGIPVQLEVPSDDAALYRVEGKVKQVVSASDGMPIAFIAIDGWEIVQRRKQDRFNVNYPCRFLVVDGPEEPRLHQVTGAGKVTDISLGGVEFETEMKLPTGVKIQVDVRPSIGRLDFVGCVVKAIDSATGMRRYGVRIDSLDTVSSYILNRLVLQLERRARRQRQIDAMGFSARKSIERRVLRESRRRRDR